MDALTTNPRLMPVGESVGDRLGKAVVVEVGASVVGEMVGKLVGASEGRVVVGEEDDGDDVDGLEVGVEVGLFDGCRVELVVDGDVDG
mmetsp:Transcript_41500/g.68308  ORF Transcript_41500/g.68308 Transcript_41500/m.68308 type:complete len:88 (+) Transcript_41500:331-594(+)